MDLASVKSSVSAWKKPKRLGRGSASGLGKTSGKGNKGQKSRSGYGGKAQKQGGQMPLFRRLPKRGFNNKRFRTRFEVVNVGNLERFSDGSVVGVRELADAGLVRSAGASVKILGDGGLSKKLTVTASAFSKKAAGKIAAAGGAANVKA